VSLRASSSMAGGCRMCATSESSSECEEEEEEPEGGDGDRSGEGERGCVAVKGGALLV
jgi:hypothetical protein